MEARFVMIHQVQFSNFFLFISHMPVNAAADVNESAMGTVLGVNVFKTKKRRTQQVRKNKEAFFQSFLLDLVTLSTLRPQFCAPT